MAKKKADASEKTGVSGGVNNWTPPYGEDTHMGVIHSYNDKGELMGVSKAADPEAGNPLGKPWDVVRLHNELDWMKKAGLNPKFSLVEHGVPKPEAKPGPPASGSVTRVSPSKTPKTPAKPKKPAGGKTSAKPAAKKPAAAKPAAKKPVAKKPVAKKGK
ncbi:MAG: hypothetical protein EBR82_18745 [Caulobacteraceae bacterium]|nr:hypothetical protein [Caulobacteraceae bacterium]